MSVILFSQYAQDAQAKLLQQFQSSPNMAVVLSSIMAEVQAAENAVVGILATRAIPTAQGAYLDVIGRIVGAPTRQAAGITESDDADYRVVLYCQIRANLSTGTPDDLYAVIQPFLDSVSGSAQISYSGPAAFIVLLNFVATSTQAQLLAGFIKKSRLGGVYGMVLFYESPLVDVFTYDAGPGYDTGFYAGALAS